jgi:hypothetical protein
MPTNGVGPPEKGVGPDATNADANQQVSDDTTTTANDRRSSRQSRYDGLAGNARRFAAKRRLPPIPTCVCGRCVRDPDLDRHRCGGQISDHMAEAAVAAVVLLDQLGTPGLLDERTCRAMFRIGHRRIATAVRCRSAGAA